MVNDALESGADRVLVLTPTGRDADMLRQQIVADDMACEICADLAALIAAISRGAGAVVVAQEALTQGGAEQLLAELNAQKPWSDIPILFLADARSTMRPLVLPAYFERANVTLLQRPLGIRLFLSSVRSAVRARRRQYQMRDLNRELERAVQLSDMFVSILGHDLRNPLAAIRLAAQSVIRLSTDDRTLRPAGRVLTAADRMTRMIEQLLDFARARQGRGIPLRLERMDLGELCRGAIQELEDAAPDTSFEFHEVGNACGVWDADRLAQVVMNLAGNAVQYGREHMPIAIEVDGTDPSTVRLRVQNLGTIPRESFPTLFEAFKHTPATDKSIARSAGLGLGLFIAREVARAHGGEIIAQSSDDRTTFEVTLPREAHPIDTGALTTT
jgi:signal transduction histidine kinase